MRCDWLAPILVLFCLIFIHVELFNRLMIGIYIYKHRWDATHSIKYRKQFRSSESTMLWYPRLCELIVQLIYWKLKFLLHIPNGSQYMIVRDAEENELIANVQKLYQRAHKRQKIRFQQTKRALKFIALCGSEK